MDDCILFKFTIHYMLLNFEILLKNIINVDNKNTIIIISFIDGDIIEKKLKENNGRYEIILGDEPLYGIYDMNERKNNLHKVTVYFKGVYGVDNGSVEYLVNSKWLINKFYNIGYKVIENKNFLNIDKSNLVDLRNKLNNDQKKVSEIHKILVLKKM